MLLIREISVGFAPTAIGRIQTNYFKTQYYKTVTQPLVIQILLVVELAA